MPAPLHGPRAGVTSASITADHTLNSNDTVCQVLTPDAARTVNINTIPRRGFGFRIRNGATVVGRTLAITDPADAAIVTIDAGEVYDVIGNGVAYIPFALSESTVLDLTLSDALTAAGDLINGTLTINHATATAEGLDLSVSQLTTARSSGEVIGAKVTLTGVATDSGGTYVGLDLNASDAGGSGTFVGVKMDAGWDAFADLSECATGEADIIVGDNLASALQIREASNLYATVTSTNSNEVLAFHSGLTLGTRHDDSVPNWHGTGYDLNIVHDGTDSIIDSANATAKLKLRLGTDTSATSLVVEQDGGNDLLTITGDAQHAAYIKDNSTTAYTIAEAGNNYLLIDTSDAGALMTYGNTATFPTHGFRGIVTTDDAVTSGSTRRVGGRADVAVAAGTSHTGSTDETVLKSYSIPANTIKQGTTVRVKFGARVTADNGATTLTGRLRLGTTTLTGTELIVTSALDTSSGHWFSGEFMFTGRASPGAAAAVVGVGNSFIGAIGASGAATVQQALPATNFATNGALLLELTADWSAADANAVQMEFWHVEVIG